MSVGKAWFEFEWTVHSEHAWVADKDPGGPRDYVFTGFSTPFGADAHNLVLSGIGKGTRQELLRDNSGLFRDFAGVPLEKEAIVAFADSYGLLGLTQKATGPIGVSLSQVDGGKSRRIADPRVRGRWRESLYQWCFHISTMRLAVELWDAARVGDESRLKSHFTWRNRSWHMPQLVESAVDWSGFGRFVGLQERSIVRAAMGAVAGILESRLYAAMSVRPTWQSDWSWRFVIVPPTLLDAMWLQFGAAFTMAKDFAACSECGKWFEVSPDAGRKDKSFCSGRCRVRAHRQRKRDDAESKREAIRLRREGKSLAAIAKSVGSELATVKNWLRDTPKGGT